MEERNIKVSLEEAKKWYKGDVEALKVLALQVFNKKELEEPKLPKSWKEYCKGNYKNISDETYVSLVLLKRLIAIRNIYRQGWKPDWAENEQIWFVCCDDESLNIDWGISRAHLFSFPTQELTEQFLENFREELEQLKELL